MDKEKTSTWYARVLPRREVPVSGQ